MIRFGGGEFELLLCFFSFKKEVGDGLAAIRFATHGQKSFCRRIHMDQQQIAINQNYGCAQAIQQGFIDIAFSQVASDSKMPWEGAGL